MTDDNLRQAATMLTPAPGTVVPTDLEPLAAAAHDVIRTPEDGVGLLHLLALTAGLLPMRAARVALHA